MDSVTLSRCRPAAGGRPLAAGRPRVNAWTWCTCPFFFEFFFSCPPLFEQVVNSCWLVSAHARPT
jgi:hypothetical protein